MSLKNCSEESLKDKEGGDQQLSNLSATLNGLGLKRQVNTDKQVIKTFNSLPWRASTEK